MQETCGGDLPCDLGAGWLHTEGLREKKKAVRAGDEFSGPSFKSTSSVGLVPEAARSWDGEATSTAGFPEFLPAFLPPVRPRVFAGGGLGS